MADQPTQALEHELTRAIEDLQAALRRAHEASTTLQALLPRVAQVSTLFDELAAVINTGRAQLGSTVGTAYARPTLVAPSEPTPAPEMKQGDDPWTQLAETFREGAEKPAAGTPGLTSFRLEFESKSGPLDLRAVDDAVSEHHAVKDVALIDYDGKRATLKVWIDESATPHEVQSTLSEKATALFGPENEVTVVAVEDQAA
jgi:hypothetical protein